ncbi:MAG: ATP-binding protein, partial [Thermoleophilaceae bacterium]
MVRRVSSSIFVGRVPERAELIAGLEAAGRGEPGLVVLGGEAGIGKSRLAAELWATANARGARVVSGRCLETRAVTLPFAPWIEILRDVLLADRERVVAVSPEPGLAELARLVPELRSSLGPDAQSPSGDDPGQLFHAVLDLLRRVAKGRPPLLILVEDLHWADASSLDLLRFIAAQLTGEPLLIVATFRNDELRESQGLQAALGELVRLPHVLRLDLRPFDQREVADQLTGISGRPSAPDVVNQIFARSDGNPFVVEELAGQPSGSPLPPTLRDVMAARMSTLSPETRRVVAAAAAIGRDVGGDILATVAGMPEHRVQQALNEATDQHVLVRAASSGTADYAFRHALIQEFAYGELSPAERRALHGEISKALIDAGGSSGEVARHARLAGHLSVALASAVAAADEATAALAFAEALTYVQQALKMWDEVADPEATGHTDRPALLALGARCAVAIGDWGQAVALRRSALSLLDPARRAERIALLLDLADSLQFSADWPGVTETIRQAAALIPTSPPTAQRARVVAELANSAMD